MATVPLSGTNIRFISGVPFNNDYKNSRWFTSRANQTSYFQSKPFVHRMDRSNFQRIEGYNYVAVNAHIDSLWGTNYLMFQNAHYESKWFYAFVTKLEYKNGSTTHVHFEIDVLQTWKFDMNFKPSYVVREHCKLWNSDGSPVINTIDEQLNYGTDYETVSMEQFHPYGDILFLVVVAKRTMHYQGATEIREITPSLNGIPQPLSYYFHPFKRDGTTVGIRIGGNPVVISSIKDALKGFFSQQDSVDNVVSAYVTEYTGVPMSYDEGTNTLNLNSSQFERGEMADDHNANFSSLYFKGIQNYSPLTRKFGNKYKDYHSVKESKLLMYPYTVLILDDFKGHRVELKNEYIDGQDLDITVRGSMGTSNNVSYAVSDYRSKKLHQTEKIMLSLEHALINSSPSDIPVINDFLSAYLQGNRNSLMNQKHQIGYEAEMGVAGSVLGAMTSATTGNVPGVGSSGLNAVKGMGDAYYKLQAINAKVKDVSNRPPSLARMGANTNFDFGNMYSGMYVIKKQILPEYREMLSDFFNMFGYKVNRVKVPNFATRKNWNYIQTESCTITGNFNNQDLDILKTIFDNGITLWHTDDVGNYSLDNGVK